MRFYWAFVSLIPVTTLLALPQDAEVVAGQAQFYSEESGSVSITTSDKAIIHYSQFDLAEGERVRFVQPSSSSAVLNRITGSDPSKIYGSIEANGKLFFVNPNGIYFGPSAKVNAASFVASVLDIANDDFLQERYHFFLQENSKNASIRNEGALSVSPQGAVALLAPHVENQGAIAARASKILLASGERVVLDFSGDGLMSFSVEGDLEKAIVANSGVLQAEGGEIVLRLRAAQKAIKNSVNMDGIEMAASIVEENGVVRLAGSAEMIAERVHVEASGNSYVEASGTIDVSSSLAQQKGGVVNILGERLSLQGVCIDASGSAGGGEVYIGGNYMGGGPLPNAYTLEMDSSSTIAANALVEGDGGSVILWSDYATRFNGKISARGGAEGGKGGFVETSGKELLGCQVGRVDVSAAKGSAGEWLLDPASAVIQTGGADPLSSITSPNCATAGTFTVDPSALDVAGAVTICSQNSGTSTITVNSAISLATPSSLTFQTSGGAITLNADVALSAVDSSITFSNNVVLGSDVQVSVGTGTGGITFSGTINGTTAATQSLTLVTDGTTGTVLISGVVGGTTQPNNLTITSGQVTFSAYVYAYSQVVINALTTTCNNIYSTRTTGEGLLQITNTINPTPNGTSLVTYTTDRVDGYPMVLGDLVMVTGGNIWIGTNGGSENSSQTGLKVNSLSYVGAGTFNFYFGNANMQIYNDVNLANGLVLNGTTYLGNVSYVDFHGNVTLGALTTGSTVSYRAFSLNFHAGSATKTIAIPATLNQTGGMELDGGSGTLLLSNALSFSTATTTVKGAVRSNATAISLATVSLGADATIDTTNSGGSPLGEAITISGAMNGAYALTVNRGTGGSLSFTTIGNTTPLTNLTITDSSTLSFTGALSITGALTQTNAATGATTFSGATSLGTAALQGTDYAINNSFSSTGAVAITNSGTVTKNATGTISAAGGFSTSGNATLANGISTTNSLISIGGNLTVAEAASPTLTAGSGGITIVGTVDGTTGSLGETLTLSASGGAISLQAVGSGDSTALTALTISASNTVGLNAAVNLTGAVAITNSGTVTKNGTGSIVAGGGFSTTGPISLSSDITTSGGIISLGATTLVGARSLDSTNSGGSPSGAAISAASISADTSLTLYAGAGNITVAGTAVVPTISLQNTGGAIAFNGAVTISTSIVQLANGYSVAFNGGGTVTPATTFTHTGGLTLNGMTFTNGVTYTAGTTTLANTTQTNGNAISLAAVTLSADAGLDSTLGGGAPLGAAITISGTINGGYGLTVNCGPSRAVSFTSIGNSTPITYLTIVDSSTLDFSSTVAMTGALTQTNAATGTTTFSNTVSLGSAVLRGTAYAITNSFASTGAVAITNSGTVTKSATGDITASGGFSTTGAVNLASNITTTNSLISLGSTLTLAEGVSSTLTAGSGGITIVAAVDGTAAGLGETLTLNAAGGAISLAAVGSGSATALTDLTITNSAALSISGAVNLTGALVQTNAATGTTTFSSAVSVGSATLRGVDYAVNANFTSAAAIAITHTGTVTIPSGVTVESGTTFTESGTGGTVSLGGTIQTQTLDLTLNSPLTLTSATAQIKSGITTLGNTIFNNTINSDGTARALTLSAHAGTGTNGNITFSGVVGGVSPLALITISDANNVQINAAMTASGLLQSAGTGTTTMAAALSLAAGNLSITTADISVSDAITVASAGTTDFYPSGTLTIASPASLVLDGAFTSHGTTHLGGVISIETTNDSIVFNAAVTLSNLGAAVALSTGGGTGNVQFVSTLNGPGDLQATAGMGNILFDSAVGGSSVVGDLHIVSAGDITALSSIAATTLRQDASSGTATYGNLSLGSGGASLTGQAFVINGNLITTGSGSIAIDNGGLLSYTAGASTSIAGNFTQTNIGAVNFQGTLIATGSISFASAVAMQAASELHSSGGSGNITLTNGVTDSAPWHALTLHSSGGNITSGAITAASLTQTGTAALTTFNGAITTHAAGGVDLNGTAFTFHSPVDTTAGSGFVSINNTAPVNGDCTLLSTITSGAAIDIYGPTVVSGTASLDSSAAGAHTILWNTLYGTTSLTDHLTITAGAGDVTLSSAVGTGVLPLGNLTIASAATLTAQAIEAASLTQTAGSVLSHFQGVLTIHGNINLTGTDITFGETVTTTPASLGSIVISHTGVLTTTAAKTITSDSSFSESGVAGTVSLNSDITTNNAALTFSSPVTLGAAALLSSQGGAISFNDTVNGTYALSVNGTATGGVTFTGLVGNTTRLAALTIVNANSVDFLDTVKAASLTQSAGAGTTTLASTKSLDVTGAVSLTGTGFTFDGATLITGALQSVTIANSGTLSLQTVSTTGIGGDFTQSGAGAVTLKGTVQPVNGAISFAGPVTLSGITALNSSGGNKAISLAAMTGAFPLTLTAGSGAIDFTGAVTSLGALTVVTANSVTSEVAGSIQAASFVTGGSFTGNVTLNGDLATTAVAGVSVGGAVVVINSSSLTTATGGGVSLTNSGALTLGSAVVANLAGAFSQSNATGVSLGASLTTANSGITFASPITLTADASLNSGAGVGNILLSSTVNGNYLLTLSSGTGSTTCSQALSVKGVDASGAAITFNGSVTGAAGGNISITNSGLLTIPFGSDFVSAGTFTQSGAGAVDLGAGITSSGALSFASSVTLTHGVSLDSGNGALSIGGATGAYALALNSGTAATTLTGAVSGLSSLQIVNANGVTAQAALSAAQITQTTGSGTTHFQSTVASTAVGGISLSGAAFTFDGGVTTAAAGPLSITHTGALTLGANGSPITLTLNGLFAESGGGAVSLAAVFDQSVGSGTFTLNGAATLVDSSSVTTNNQAIAINSTVDGGFGFTLDAGSSTIHSTSTWGTTALSSLTTTAATITHDSSVTCSGAVLETGAVVLGANLTGSSLDLVGSLTCAGANQLTASTGGITITGAVDANAINRDLQLTASSGLVDLQSAVGATTALRNLTINADTISWANLGAASSGTTGTVALTATTSTTYTGTLYNGLAQNYSSPTHAIESAAQTVFKSNGSNLVFNNNIAIGTTSDLSLQSSNGNINFDTITGAGRAVEFRLGSGVVTGNTVGTAINPMASVDVYISTLSNDQITTTYPARIDHVSGSTVITASVSYPGDQVFDAPVTINGTGIILSANNGSITFNFALDGTTADTDTLELTVLNNITFNDVVGGTVPLKTLLIDTATNVTSAAALSVGTLTQTTGTGTTSLAGSVTTTAAGGVQISTNQISVTGNITASGGGGALFALTGASAAMTTAVAEQMVLDGAFQQTGSGTVDIGGSISTVNNAISFAGTVTLNGNFSLASTGGTISFADTVAGAAKNLSLNAGSGDITLSAAATNLGAFSIPSAHTVSAAALTATSVTQTTAVGVTPLTTFSGTLTTTSASGVSLTGTSFTLNQINTTTGSGSITIDHSGTLALNGAVSAGNSFIQSNGLGSVNLGAAITTATGSISFAAPISLSAAGVSLDSSANNQNITLSSTLNGAQDIGFVLGSGTLTLSDVIGGSVPIGAMTITSVGNLSAGTISASSISQVAGTGSSNFSGDLTTSPGSINLVGTDFSLTGKMTTAGFCNIDNSGALTLSLQSGSLVNNNFTQISTLATGTVSLSGYVEVTDTYSILFGSPVTLSSAASVLSKSDLDFGDPTGAINGTTGTESLTISAGHAITFGSAIGATTAIGALAVTTTGDITYPEVHAASIVQSAGTGTAAVTGSMTALSGAISITSAAIQLQNTLTTSSNPISFVGPVSLQGNTVLTTGSGLGDLSFSSTVTGAHNLSVTAGSGSLSFAGAVGEALTPLALVQVASAQDVTCSGPLYVNHMIQNAGSGTTTFQGAVNTSGVLGIELTTADIAIQAAMTTTTGNGPITLHNSGTVTLSAAATAGAAITVDGAVVTSGLTSEFNTAANNSAITLTGAVNGSSASSDNLTLNAGSGAITLSSAAGGVVALKDFVVSNVGTLSTQAITASTITQTAGSTLSTFTGDLTTTGLGGIQLTGTAISITGALFSATGASCNIVHSGDLTLNAGVATLLKGAFTESGAGIVHLSGNLHVLDDAITLNRPVELTASTIINSDPAGGDITINNDIYGGQDLVLTAGGGNILITVDLGVATPLLSFTVQSANTVTTQAIHAGYIVQTAADSLATYGALTTTAASGIVCTGNSFLFQGAIDTSTGSGPFSVTSTAGAITLGSSANATSGGAVTLGGIGTISLGNSYIHVNSWPVSMSLPVTLTHAVSIDTNNPVIPTGGDNITFSSTVTGAYDLTLNANEGSISLDQGATGVATLTASSGANFTAGAAVSASAVALSLKTTSGTALFSSTLTTSALAGVSITGYQVTCSDTVTCSGGGMVVNNANRFSAYPAVGISVQGTFNQSGTGAVWLGGSLSTNGNSALFSGAVTLKGNWQLNSTGGTVLLNSTLDGAYNATMASGASDTTFGAVIGGNEALQSLTVTSANILRLNGVGGITSGVTGAMQLTATDRIFLNNTYYVAQSQTYSPGNWVECSTGSQMYFKTTGGDLSFATGYVQLVNGSDLSILTQGGNFSFVEIEGTSMENIAIDTGSGTATMGTILTAGGINALQIDAGTIVFTAPMTTVSITANAQSAIRNSGAPVAITLNSVNSSLLNAWNGNVGSIASPIKIITTNKIYAGADSSTYSFAVLEGSSSDNTVHDYTANTACVLIFNGVTLHDCRPATPTTATTMATTRFVPHNLFASPGFVSSYFNLSNFFYFLTPWFSNDYFQKREMLYVAAAPHSSSVAQMQVEKSAHEMPLLSEQGKGSQSQQKNAAQEPGEFVPSFIFQGEEEHSL